MPGVPGREFHCDQGERGHNGRAQDAGCGLRQAVTMVMTMIMPEPPCAWRCIV